MGLGWQLLPPTLLHLELPLACQALAQHLLVPLLTQVTPRPSITLWLATLVVLHWSIVWYMCFQTCAHAECTQLAFG